MDKRVEVIYPLGSRYHKVIHWLDHIENVFLVGNDNYTGCLAFGSDSDFARITVQLEDKTKHIKREFEAFKNNDEEIWTLYRWERPPSKE